VAENRLFHIACLLRVLSEKQPLEERERQGENERRVDRCRVRVPVPRDGQRGEREGGEGDLYARGKKRARAGELPRARPRRPWTAGPKKGYFGQLAALSLPPIPFPASGASSPTDSFRGDLNASTMSSPKDNCGVSSTVNKGCLEMSQVHPQQQQQHVLHPLRCRRKIAFHPTLGYQIAPPQPAKVARRNARERNRVKQVSWLHEKHHMID